MRNSLSGDSEHQENVCLRLRVAARQPFAVVPRQACFLTCQTGRDWVWAQTWEAKPA